MPAPLYMYMKVAFTIHVMRTCKEIWLTRCASPGGRRREDRKSANDLGVLTAAENCTLKRLRQRSSVRRDLLLLPSYDVLSPKSETPAWVLAMS